MTTVITRKIVNTAALVLTVTSLVLGAAPANAGGFGFSIGVGGDGDAGMTMSHSFTMGDSIRRGDMMFGDKSQEQLDDEWDDLGDEDTALHIRIDTNGHNVLLQQEHDCLYVKKIEALLEQMRANLKVYEQRRAEHEKLGRKDWVKDDNQVIKEEKRDIDKWEDELKKAKKECGKQWF
jgi:hypothetical protein